MDSNYPLSWDYFSTTNQSLRTWIVWSSFFSNVMLQTGPIEVFNHKWCAARLAGNQEGGFSQTITRLEGVWLKTARCKDSAKLCKRLTANRFGTINRHLPMAQVEL